MLRRIRLCAAVLIGFAGRLSAQPVVVTGTGDPNVDVPAVQAAVDQGGHVVLVGQFSFDRPPTKPAGEPYNRTITVSQPVTISGNPDANGDLPSIAGGFIPFYIEAPGSRVVIQGVSFTRPTATAIWIHAVNGLVISGCRVQRVVPSVEFGSYVPTSNPFGSPIWMTLSKPENYSGTMLISNNDFDAGAAAGEQITGIYIDTVGQSPDKEVDLYILGNNIRNISDSVIDVKSIAGRAHIEGNVITTGAISLPVALKPQAINIVGSGSYLIAHNTIVSQWATGTGIAVQGNPGLSEAGAIVTDNDVTMSAPSGTVFGTNSAGIMILGFAQGNTVLNNRIRGSARVALAAVAKSGGIPATSTFVMNDLTGFQSSLADVLVDSSVTQTIIVGPQSVVQDLGTGTIVVPTY